ncbi:MAG: cation:proton antiporter [Planctomycetaceae bacterium]|nr:cation:proton antiporter [Planctomycetaceae bacterium]
MILVAFGTFFVVRHFGESLVAPAPVEGHSRQDAAGPEPAANSSAKSSAPSSPHQLAHVLLALAVVILAGRLLGIAFRRIGQPPVIGEIVAGILLGPSLLGRVSPAALDFVFPTTIHGTLGIVSNLGLVLYMFTVGLELDGSHVRDRAHATVAISHTGIVFPFILGLILALFLYPVVSTDDVPFTGFALFMGAAMSITAFPVLARILTDRNLHRTSLGVVALTCAAADDVTAWCLLAVVVGVARARMSDAVTMLSLTAAYLGLMFFVARPLVMRYAKRWLNTEPSQNTVALLFVGLLLSAVTTEAIGIHAVFGAFLVGAMIPSGSPLAKRLVAILQDTVAVLLLPAFFAFTGLRTQIGLVSGVQAWLICAGIIAVATLGKFGGTTIAARVSGLSWRESSALGVLMNTRGLMELIVLNIGLDLKIISPTLFAMMVMMAIVTTVATAPILRRLWPENLEGGMGG